MNPENERTLTVLLRKALKSATIAQSRGDPIRPSVYRQLVRRYRSTYEPTLRFQVYLYDIQIQDTAIAEAILNLLRKELQQFIRDDKTFSASFAIFGGAGGGSPIKDVLKNLIKEAIVGTPENVARAFYDSVARGYMVFQNYYLLTGIKVEKEVHVLDGISLMPLPNSTADLPAHLPPTFNVSSVEFVSKTLLKVDVSVSPILHKPAEGYTFVSGPDEHFRTRVHSADVEDFHPGRFFHALTLVGEQPVQAALMWRHLSDYEIFDLSMGTGSGYSSSSVSTAATSTNFSEAQISQAIDLYHKIVDLPPEVLNQLEIPIDRWMKSKTQQGYVDKMIDLGIAFESFFLRGISQEVTFRFSLRGSLYLEEDLEGRSRLKRELEQFYRYRSRAVHEGTLPDNVSVNGESVRTRQFIERGQELFKQSLLKVIERRSLPDWSTIELGGGVETDTRSSELAECSSMEVTQADSDRGSGELQS